MNKRRGFLARYTPPVPDLGTSSSSSSSTSGLPDLGGGDLTESEAQYYRALGLLPSRSRKRPQAPAQAPDHRGAQAFNQTSKAPDVTEPEAVGTRSALGGAARKDAPSINYSTGVTGSKRAKFETLDREALLERLESDVNARSAQSSVSSLSKAWTRFHDEWFQGSQPPFPLRLTR